MKEYNCAYTTDFDLSFDFAKEHFKCADWQQFKETEFGEFPPQKTDFAMIYSEQYLYAYYIANDINIVADYTAYNDPLYNEDAVELFICPTGDLTSYFEYEVSPKNVQFFGSIQNDLSGNIKLTLIDKFLGQTISQITSNGYESIIKIPLSELKICHKTNTEVMFNAFRVDNNKEEDLSLYALSPTGKRRFHLPKYFLKLIFTK